MCLSSDARCLLCLSSDARDFCLGRQFGSGGDFCCGGLGSGRVLGLTQNRGFGLGCHSIQLGQASLFGGAPFVVNKCGLGLGGNLLLNDLAAG